MALAALGSVWALHCVWGTSYYCGENSLRSRQQVKCTRPQISHTSHWRSPHNMCVCARALLGRPRESERSRCPALHRRRVAVGEVALSNSGSMAKLLSRLVAAGLHAPGPAFTGLNTALERVQVSAAGMPRRAFGGVRIFAL